MKIISSFAVVMAMAISYGCGTNPEEVSGSAPSRVKVSTRLPTPSSSSLPGYAHLLSNSHFAMGTSPVARTEYGMDKIVGSEGTFATFPITQMVLAVPNADAPSKQVARYPGAGSDHNAAVLAYFVGAGLPQNQVGPIEVHSRVRGSIQTSGSLSTSTPELVAYTSYVTRQVGGVQIADSYAWARLNANGDVVTESVYWPEIQGSVVDDATAFSAVLADPAATASFYASLPSDVLAKTGTLYVHHTPGNWNGAFEAVTTFDMVEPSGRVRHFTQAATEYQLASEAPNAYGPATNTPKGNP
jgi:hypothetical protein